jgi:hypothetical protein
VNLKSLAIPSAIGLFVVAILVIFSFVTTLHPRPYNGLNADGLQSVYKIGQPIVFTDVMAGYGTGTCNGPVTTIFDIEDPTKPVFSDKGSQWACPSTPNPQSYTYFYPSRTSPFSVAINKTGIYRLEISWGSIRSSTSFDVMPAFTNATNSASGNKTIIEEIGNLSAVKKFLVMHPDAKARVKNNVGIPRMFVEYYTKTGLFNSTIGTFYPPEYRTLKLIVSVNLFNNTAIPSYLELVCSVYSHDNKTATDYTLFPHNDLNLTFDGALQSNLCLGGN